MGFIEIVIVIVILLLIISLHIPDYVIFSAIRNYRKDSDDFKNKINSLTDFVETWEAIKELEKRIDEVENQSNETVMKLDKLTGGAGNFGDDSYE